MKYLAALAFVLFACSAFADDVPAVSAAQAAAAAEKNMADRGVSKDIYIASITLAHPTLLGGGEAYWLVKYSHPIPYGPAKQQEIGIKVRMDGSVARLVKHLDSSALPE